MKCSGGKPCSGCARSGQPCIYSEPNRLGRPKGSKNKKAPGVDKSKSDRSRNETVETAAVEGARPNGTAPSVSLDQHLFLGEGICSPQAIEGWNDLVEESLWTDLDENGFLSNMSPSDFSWEQPSDVFGSLEAEIGTRGYEPDPSVFSLVRVRSTPYTSTRTRFAVDTCTLIAFRRLTRGGGYCGA